MLKRLSVLLLAVAVLCGSAVADAATKHKAKSHSVNATAKVAQLSTTGSPPVNGTSSDAGAFTGSLGAGALSQSVTYAAPNFSSSGTAFTAKGSVKFTLKGTGTPQSNGSITLSGTGKVKGGSGIYKGATGTLTFTGGTPGLNQPATFSIKGTIKY